MSKIRLYLHEMKMWALKQDLCVVAILSIIMILNFDMTSSCNKPAFNKLPGRRARGQIVAEVDGASAKSVSEAV